MAKQSSKTTGQEPEFLNVDSRQNAIDSLETSVTFLRRDDDWRWKWLAIAVHHALYSFSVTALEDGNPMWVLTGNSRKDDEGHFCKRGQESLWSKSKRIMVGTGPAYRIAWDTTTETPPPVVRVEDDFAWTKMKLISLWTALARVQDGHWMGRTVDSKPVVITDESLKTIQWLAFRVRNELVHFVPKHLGIEIDGIRHGCLHSLAVIEALVFESNTLWCIGGSGQDRVKRAIAELRKGLTPCVADSPSPTT